MQKSKQAFTLVEMLVVVAVIGILAALLSPSLRNAIESAKALRCLHGHRAIGMAMIQFADSFNGRLPNGGSRICGSNGSVSWHNILNLTIMSGNKDYPIVRMGQVPSNASNNFICCPNAGYIAGYDRHLGLNADLGEKSAVPVTDCALWPGKPWSDVGSSSYSLGARISRARHPSKLITVADINGGGADQFSYYGSYAADGTLIFESTATPEVTKVANLAFRHGRGFKMTVLYLGGNVAQLSPEAQNFRNINFKLRP